MVLYVDSALSNRAARKQNGGGSATWWADLSALGRLRGKAQLLLGETNLHSLSSWSLALPSCVSFTWLSFLTRTHSSSLFIPSVGLIPREA